MTKETLDLISFLHDSDVASCITTGNVELLAKVGGDCKVPAGIYATAKDGGIEAHAFIASNDGKRLYRSERSAAVSEAVSVGKALAAELLDAGKRGYEEMQEFKNRCKIRGAYRVRSGSPIGGSLERGHALNI